MAIFNCYVSSPEGSLMSWRWTYGDLYSIRWPAFKKVRSPRLATDTLNDVNSQLLRVENPTGQDRGKHPVLSWYFARGWVDGRCINPMERWVWINRQLYVRNICLVLSNMAFIFHFIYEMSPFPLTNSYFSRWLKSPTRSYSWFNRLTIITINIMDMAL